MPSIALTRWRHDRMFRLGHTDAHCVTLFGPAPAPAGAPAGPRAPLAQESLQGYVMLVSGHFQGFCRDLYTECSQICAAAVPGGLLATVQAQFAAELKLNTGTRPSKTSGRTSSGSAFASILQAPTQRMPSG